MLSITQACTRIWADIHLCKLRTAVVKQPLWCALLRVHVPVLYEPHPLILQTCISCDADEDQTIITELSSTHLSDGYEAETGDFTTTTTTITTTTTTPT